ncbi:WD-repeat protein, putative [Trichomonas vaginalis G3]|uniref:WD-repeat protein, putative n=1 Tax=Trichomonas vaginalis (strain ATCC PRA-98 / G3) TaxID=412133 RepID=A2F8I8_TRIV3|nr:positive regulation of dense core granule transport [Trichomonas vaginalis G3]EAX98781.1 WD-repeat protein, putative [Trichomonas vaginalis G3]KAI5483862.1 positive regulation of dense core granule transport [Trichomonas vaginalis G3]|eukprot:XP_001311711.1 WD-repeat protein [Trichomonas vaginalis G3]
MSQQKFKASVTPYAGLKSSCRHIASQEACTDTIRFVVGSSVVGKTNQLQIIQYDDMQSTIQCMQTLEHANEVRWITCNPTNEKILFTVSSNPQNRQTLATLYKLPEFSATQDTQKMETIATFENTPDATRVHYLPNDQTKCLITSKTHLSVYDINDPSKPISTKKITDAQINASAPDPLHPNTFATASEDSIKLWDMRDDKLVYEIQKAHAPSVLDISLNENKPWWICSGGSDGSMKCWDFRVGKVECEFRASSHWVTRVIPSTSHEQLILTTGTDSKVRVFNALKFAFQSEGKLSDGEIVKSIRHDDSVYCATWATSNPWVFASVSYKGQVNVCQLPSEVVDAILMGDDSDSN